MTIEKDGCFLPVSKNTFFVETTDELFTVLLQHLEA
jgi:hypothetical protein